MFRGWSLRILAIVTYETATRSVAVDKQWTLYTTALGATPQYQSQFIPNGLKRNKCVNAGNKHFQFLAGVFLYKLDHVFIEYVLYQN
jgi:hypothetical protein